jgi:hypothetical protein
MCILKQNKKVHLHTVSVCTCRVVTHVKLMASVITLSKIGAHRLQLASASRLPVSDIHFETVKQPCQLVKALTWKQIINTFDVLSVSSMVLIFTVLTDRVLSIVSLNLRKKSISPILPSTFARFGPIRMGRSGPTKPRPVLA